MAAAEDVYCTLVMSDSYLPGAAVLAHSLRDAGTTKKIAALVTVDTLLYETLTQLRELFDYVIPVHRIANPNLENLARLDRLDLRYTFTKLNLWRQEQFRKIVYIDADVVALRAPDELFDIDAPFAAAPDIGWPDCFNSGVMMLKPNEGEFWSLQTLAASGVSFDGADQGLLNEYYGNRPWKRLSFTYNCTPSSGYQYEPAYRHYRSSISMAHFIGKDKPWTLGRSALESSGSGVYKELLGRWWSVFDRHHRKEPSPQIQQFVKDDGPQHGLAWAASGLVPAPTGQEHSSSAPPPPPEASHVTAEQPFTETTEQVQEMDHNQPEPPVFEPPQNQWDATRSAPPIISKAEASSFPTDTHYEMSSDRNLFQPPASYPEPPKNMYYSVPETKPKPFEEPKPIFPWEQNKSARKPTRVFAEAPSRPSTPPPQGLTKLSTDATDVRVKIPPPQEYSIRANAWDNDPGIEEYLRAYKEATARRGRALPGHAHTTSTEALASPSLGQRRDGPRSLRLTDFPSSDERPSLPVTPAPIQRPTFWGQERNEQGELPAAEGVPTQAQWNPLAQLEELRRNSLLAAEDLEKLAVKETPTPLRETLPTAAPLPTSPPAVEVPAAPKQDDASSGSATATASDAAAAASATKPTLLNPFEVAIKEDEEKGATLIDPKSVLGSTAH